MSGTSSAPSNRILVTQVTELSNGRRNVSIAVTGGNEATVPFHLGALRGIVRSFGCNFREHSHEFFKAARNNLGPSRIPPSVTLASPQLGATSIRSLCSVKGPSNGQNICSKNHGLNPEIALLAGTQGVREAASPAKRHCDLLINSLHNALLTQGKAPESGIAVS